LAVSAVGIAKFADIFPFPPGQGWWVVLLIGSFLTMILVVGFFTYRLSRVSDRILVKSDVDRMDDLKDDEKRMLRPLYLETARLNRAPSLPALEARARRLYRIADRTKDHALANRAMREANDAVADVRSVEARANMIVVRRRGVRAIRSLLSIAVFALLALAIVGFGISSDKLDSERTQLTKLVKDCAAAKKASSEVNSMRVPPRICHGPSVAVKSSVTLNVPGSTLQTPSQTPAKGTTERLRAASAALRAAASFASLLAPLGAATAAQAAEGRHLLNDFLNRVGFPLAKDGISRLAGTLWDRYAVAKPPPLPEVVVVPPQRLVIQLLGAPYTPPFFINGVAPLQPYQTIKLTVLVRDRRPRVEIVRVPVDPDG
jgi:hypothetical protein